MKRLSTRAVLIAGILLALIALLHLFRVFFPAPIIIGSVSIPVWLSAIVFVVSGGISAYLFRAFVRLSEKPKRAQKDIPKEDIPKEEIPKEESPKEIL